MLSAAQTNSDSRLVEQEPTLTAHHRCNALTSSLNVSAIFPTSLGYI